MGSPRLAPDTVRDALASREPLSSLRRSPCGDDPKMNESYSKRSSNTSACTWGDASPLPTQPQEDCARVVSSSHDRDRRIPTPSPRQACLRQTHPVPPCWEEPWPSQASAGGRPHSNRAQLHCIISTTTTRGRPSF